MLPVDASDYGRLYSQRATEFERAQPEDAESDGAPPGDFSAQLALGCVGTAVLLASSFALCFCLQGRSGRQWRGARGAEGDLSASDEDGSTSDEEDRAEPGHRGPASH